MLSSRSWMWSSLGLAIVVGVCIGVVGDRLLLMEDIALADVVPPEESESSHWFLCTERGSLDIEEEPGYLFTEEVRHLLLTYMQERLELREPQIAALQSYLEESRHGVHEFWENSRLTFCDMRDAFRVEIRTILDDRQRDRWDEMTAQTDRREAEYVRRLGDDAAVR